MSPEYENPQYEVLVRMERYLDEWRSSGDPRQTFLACYHTMTGNMFYAIESGFFEDPQWVRRLLDHFADYYFNALVCYECDEPLSAIWKNVHQKSADRRLHPVQLLMLGVNAHINYDLVLALKDMLEHEWREAPEELRGMRHRDHCRVNDVIARSIDQVQDEIIEPGYPMMAMIDTLCGRLDEYLLSRLITRWRSEVWTNSIRMLECASATEAERLRSEIEMNVIGIGKRITAVEF